MRADARCPAGKRRSSSRATVELTPAGTATSLIFTEQDAFLDGADHPEERDQGTPELLDKLGELLDRPIRLAPAAFRAQLSASLARRNTMSATSIAAPHSSRTTNIVYWTTTALVALMMLQGGIFEVMRIPSSVEVMRGLGYPAYLNTILGVAKLLGVAAILLPVPRTLREWAYAGFTFDVTGAIASFVAIGAVNPTLLIPIFSLVLVLTSYWTWRRREAAALRTAPSTAPGFVTA